MSRLRDETPSADGFSRMLEINAMTRASQRRQYAAEADLARLEAILAEVSRRRHASFRTSAMRGSLSAASAARRASASACDLSVPASCELDGTGAGAGGAIGRWWPLRALRRANRLGTRRSAQCATLPEAPEKRMYSVGRRGQDQGERTRRTELARGQSSLPIAPCRMSWAAMPQHAQRAPPWSRGTSRQLVRTAACRGPLAARSTPLRPSASSRALRHQRYTAESVAPFSGLESATATSARLVSALRTLSAHLADVGAVRHAEAWTGQRASRRRAHRC